MTVEAEAYLAFVELEIGSYCGHCYSVESFSCSFSKQIFEKQIEPV